MAATNEADQTGGKKERAFAGVLCIDDGYTLRGLIRDAEKPEDRKRPTITVWYRPALPEVVMDYQMQNAAAKNGADRMTLKQRVLDAHIVRWEGLYRKPGPMALDRSPIPVEFKPADGKGEKGTLADPSVRRALGADYIEQMLALVAGYEPGEWEEDEKNC